MTNENTPGSTSGSGSAENRGKTREQQLADNLRVDEQERSRVAGSAGVGKKDIADLEELGAASGRDDYAGGDNEGMSEESTGKPTDR
jgi:hypothetical protein